MGFDPIKYWVKQEKDYELNTTHQILKYNTP